MENFIVSARKYRPQTFDTVVGQQAITTTLKNAIRNNQLAQAFLFCGPRGIGKTTCARILAKTINCYHLSSDIVPCDTCESCLSFNTSASFNIHELDAASNNSVDDIRNLVDQVRIPPQVGRYKVYIIDEVHMLSQQAFNAFLKTLEEPPAYAKFILATTEKHKIIPTILSRCQIYDFKRISVEDITQQLIKVAQNEQVTFDPDALRIIAQKADGAMRDALSMFDQIVSFSGSRLTYETVINNLNVLDYDYYFKMVDCILNADIPSSLLILNEILDNGFDGQHFLIGMGEHLRNLLVSKDPSTVKLLETGEGLRERYLNQSRKCSVDLLLKALDMNNRCDLNYKTSNHKRLHIEITLMQMCSLSEGYNRFAKPAGDTVKPAEHKPEAVSPPAKPKEPVAQDIPTLRQTPVRERTMQPGCGVSIKEKTSPPKENDPSSGLNSEYHTPRSEEPFDQVQLEEAWAVYASTIAEASPNFHSTLTKRKPLLQDDFTIELTIDNKVQEVELNDKKQELLGFLRTRLKNDQIRISARIHANSQDQRPYTPLEKYKKMTEKNPDLAHFKDQLGLEIDY
ncbi:MAG: DNA polymerase III subunit gamma/tau [Lentimicrobiaceae bacterium]|nr:DNA polymerase III subunit gamma/tau [Lentimicrobiaceae bacterium]